MLTRGIFAFKRTGPVTLEDANQLVGVISRITLKYSKQVNELISRLEAMGPADIDKTTKLEKEASELIEQWNDKVKKLGAFPKGLWIVDFDAGDGYYCWKYPETEITFWHDYQSGYSGRVPLNEKYKGSALRKMAREIDDNSAL